ncbi:MAG: hypothetical protein U5R30_12665 [Deltaproteobacteria bacterium]|nr:hypothetical protein [Deltaproteobacteria bacterium]
MLGKLLITPVNLLLLDEPTNHLDMESCDALLAALDNFAGAVVMVTHNEMFLHALARRLVVFQSDGIEIFDGSYECFLERRLAGRSAVRAGLGRRHPGRVQTEGGSTKGKSAVCVPNCERTRARPATHRAGSRAD